MGILRFI